MITIISYNPHYKRQLESYRRPQLPIWTMPVFEQCGVTRVLRWSGAGCSQRRSSPAFRHQAAESSACSCSAVCSLAPQPAHLCTASNPNVPLPSCKPTLLTPCLCSGCIQELLSATGGCSCPSDYYRNAQFLHTININWGIPLLPHKYGFQSAKGFTKMKFHQLLNCRLLFLLPWIRTAQQNCLLPRTLYLQTFTFKQMKLSPLLFSKLEVKKTPWM